MLQKRKNNENAGAAMPDKSNVEASSSVQQSSFGMAMLSFIPLPSQRLINHVKQTWKNFVERFSSESKEVEILKDIDSAIETLVKTDPGQYNKEADNLKDAKASKPVDITIKMWDRVPQKDLFQGNYSTCCIGMGGGNGSAQPHYLLNTSCNMIEFVDNVTGKPIGNALCYFAIVDGKPALIIDNIEINNSYKLAEENGIELRNAITEYAHRIAKEVTGSDDTHIYMGGSYNDVPTSDLQSYFTRIEFLGDLDCEELYLDVYSGWVEKSDLNSTRNILRLK